MSQVTSLFFQVSVSSHQIFSNSPLIMCVCVCVCETTRAHVLSHVQVFATPWTGARQAPLSMGFSRQESQSGLPSPSPRDLPNPGTEPMSPMSPALVGRFFTTREAFSSFYLVLIYYLNSYTQQSFLTLVDVLLLND